MLTSFKSDNGDLCFSYGSIIALLMYKDLDNYFYVDFTTSNKSVQFDGSVDSITDIAKNVSQRCLNFYGRL